MKKIKFPLEMKNGKQVRELEEFQEYFDLAKAVEYFSSGRLQEWLKNSYNDDILEEIDGLTGQEDDFVEQFTRALGVEGCAEKIDVREEMEKAGTMEKLKQFYPEKTAEELLPSAADSQERVERLLAKGRRKIHLLPGKYRIPANARSVTFAGIQNPEIFLEAEDRGAFVRQKNRFSDIIPADDHARRLLQGSDLNDMCAGLMGVLKRNLDKMR